jgi:hypothetical protein
VQPSIGLFFSDTPPTRTPISVKLESQAIDIPAGDANYVVEDSYVLPVDVEAVSVYPHAHYLGKDMRGTATFPDGSQQDLLWIPPVGHPLAGPVSLPVAVVPPTGHAAVDAVHLRQLRGESAQPHQSAAARAAGPRSIDEMAQLWLEVVPRRPRTRRC